MTRPIAPLSRQIPTSWLLPPSPSSPTSFFPSPSAALLGPLPPTTPLHLALNYLIVTDGEAAAQSASKVYERVLIVTGHADELRLEIEEEDEDWLRLDSGTYGTLDRLRRVEMRCCPTIDHVQLLLTMLSTDTRCAPKEASLIRSRPGLVILWNIAELLMEPDDISENDPDEQDTEARRGKLRFRERPPGRDDSKSSVILSDYMNAVSAAKSMVEQISILSTGARPAQLLLLEPHLDAFSALPILHPTAPTDKLSKLSTPTRRKRISILDALRSRLGPGSVGLIEPHLDADPSDETRTHFSMSWPNADEKMRLVRRKCEKSDWSSASVAESRITGFDGASLADDTTGWRWEWIDV